MSNQSGWVGVLVILALLVVLDELLSARGRRSGRGGGESLRGRLWRALLGPSSRPPFRLRDDFLSPAELTLYHLLVTVTPSDRVVLTKVSLRDLFFVPEGSSGTRLGWRNRIDRKHVDFLVCDRLTLHPLVGVELDDSSHTRANRMRRDTLVDRVFDAARLTLVRIRAQSAYTVEELRRTIQRALADLGATDANKFVEGSEHAERSAERNPIPPFVSTAPESPACPRCGMAMVQRTAHYGARAGGTFWGCPNYPRCHGTRPIPTSQPKDV